MLRKRANPGAGVAGARKAFPSSNKPSAHSRNHELAQATLPLAFHPLANIFPLLEGAEFDELVIDIKANGLHEPIVVYEDQILDGRNRYRACTAAGVSCKFETYEGDDPLGFCISANLRRRHLDESQRAMVAADLANFSHGGDRSKSPIGDLTQADAAKLLNVGKRSVE